MVGRRGLGMLGLVATPGGPARRAPQDLPKAPSKATALTTVQPSQVRSYNKDSRFVISIDFGVAVAAGNASTRPN